MFFCRYGQRVGKDSVHCRADLYAAGVFTIPSALYGVSIFYCLHYCNVTAKS
nr:MAG TPA: hypothetical protein [Caudoviricetes sp.]